jgi:hypothetical protein
VPLAFPLWLVTLALGSLQVIPGISAALGILGSCAWYAAHALALKTSRVPYRYLLLLPLSYLFVAIVNADGLLRRIRGKRLWKGRRM